MLQRGVFIASISHLATTGFFQFLPSVDCPFPHSVYACGGEGKTGVCEAGKSRKRADKDGRLSPMCRQTNKELSPCNPRGIA